MSLFSKFFPKKQASTKKLAKQGQIHYPISLIKPIPAAGAYASANALQPEASSQWQSADEWNSSLNGLSGDDLFLDRSTQQDDYPTFGLTNKEDATLELTVGNQNSSNPFEERFYASDADWQDQKIGAQDTTAALNSFSELPEFADSPQADLFQAQDTENYENTAVMQADATALDNQAPETQPESLTEAMNLDTTQVKHNETAKSLENTLEAATAKLEAINAQPMPWASQENAELDALLTHTPPNYLSENRNSDDLFNLANNYQFLDKGQESFYDMLTQSASKEAAEALALEPSKPENASNEEPAAVSTLSRLQSTLAEVEAALSATSEGVASPTDTTAPNSDDDAFIDLDAQTAQATQTAQNTRASSAGIDDDIRDTLKNTNAMPDKLINDALMPSGNWFDPLKGV
ncbi:MAG: hypothetical protein VKJ06_07460 [Vampirovibrionales bacterium]|nr:hypothetical protein [Vampirovibrionales bacterium]